MAKKKQTVEDTGTTFSQAEPLISFEKYVQISGADIHKYTRAALGEVYRGTMKVASEWSKELKDHIVGGV